MFGLVQDHTLTDDSVRYSMNLASRLVWFNIYLHGTHSFSCQNLEGNEAEKSYLN